MAKIEIRRGAEGPRHDPYAYTELTFVPTSGGPVVVIHSGLAEWCESELGRVEGELAARGMFIALTGITPEQAEKAYRFVRDVLPYRLHNMKCENRVFACVGGFPGESFTICPVCGEHLEYSFDRSAIE